MTIKFTESITFVTNKGETIDVERLLANLLLLEYAKVVDTRTDENERRRFERAKLLWG